MVFQWSSTLFSGRLTVDVGCLYGESWKLRILWNLIGWRTPTWAIDFFLCIISLSEDEYTYNWNFAKSATAALSRNEQCYATDEECLQGFDVICWYEKEFVNGKCNCIVEKEVVQLIEGRSSKSSKLLLKRDSKWLKGATFGEETEVLISLPPCFILWILYIILSYMGWKRG